MRNYDDLSAIINALSDGIYIADAEGNYITVNDAALEMEGLDRSDFIGHNASELFEKGILEKDDIMVLAVIESGDIVNKYKEQHNGRMIMATGTPVFKNGELYRIIVQERDITTIVNLQQNLDYVSRQKEYAEKELMMISSESIAGSSLAYKNNTMKSLLSSCQKIAPLGTTVLITGESGTGKGVLAKYIHERSGRFNFIKLDCTAIPETLFESELFGYEPGSFTGADSRGKIGRAELANKGTLFIDEIGELPLSLQSKLLTMVQDRELYRIGGKKPIPVDIRIIAATNRNLEQMVENGTFRRDLFFRLNVFPITLPPLRERSEDIFFLAGDILKRFNGGYGTNKTFTPHVISAFESYSWPGNIRELENTIERLVITTTADTITPLDLPDSILSMSCKSKITDDEYFATSPYPFDYASAFAAFEKGLLTSAVKMCSSTKEMSSILGLATNTITTKLKKYEISTNYKRGPKPR